MYFDAKATGERISELRTSKKMTQEILADRLSITVNYLGKIETGFRTPSIDLLIEMSELFCVSLDYIILGITDSSFFLKREIEGAIEILTQCAERL